MSEKWCPHGIIATRRILNGKVELLSIGGFNIVEDHNSGGLVHRSPCIGKKCMHFKKTIFFPVEGRCGLEPHSSFLPIIMASLLFAGTVVASIFFI